MKKLGFLFLLLVGPYWCIATETPTASVAANQGSDRRIVNAMGQLYLGDHDRQLDVFKRITPGFELGEGKWLTKYLALRLGINSYALKRLTQDAGLSNGKVYDESPDEVFSQLVE